MDSFLCINGVGRIMPKIIPVPQAGTYRTGALYASRKEIEKVLGFKSNCEDDPDKVKYSWGFTVGGVHCGIWDYKGSHKYNQFSTYGPKEIFKLLFGNKAKQD